MISDVVREEFDRIEKEITEKSSLLLNNSESFNRRYRGNENLDVNLFFIYNEVTNETEINLYVADNKCRLLHKYIIRNNKLVNVYKNTSKGHKRVKI